MIDFSSQNKSDSSNLSKIMMDSSALFALIYLPWCSNQLEAHDEIVEYEPQSKPQFAMLICYARPSKHESLLAFRCQYLPTFTHKTLRFRLIQVKFSLLMNCTAVHLEETHEAFSSRLGAVSWRDLRFNNTHLCLQTNQTKKKKKQPRTQINSSIKI